MDDAPPPPYALRDPHSGPAQPSPSPSPQYITAFNAELDGTTSPDPRLSARRSFEQTSVPIPYSATQNPVSPIQVPPTNPEAGRISEEDLRKAGFVSAAVYFEMRIPAQMRPRETFYHHMILFPTSRPDNLPFPAPIEKWTIRGVDDQDWMTFLNHMFPPHEADIKYRDIKELEADAGSDMSGLPLSKARSSEQSRPIVGNQPGPSNGGQDSEMERLRRLRIEAVASQWNQGFFGPRGLAVLIDISSITPVTPVPAQTAPRRSSGNVLQKRPPPELEESLLHTAVAKGKKSQVKLLLDKGGEDMEALNKKGQTALYVAVSRGDKDIVQLLLGNGADPTARPPDADSPLQIAVYHGRKTILKYLLAKSRIGIETPNSKGETLLYMALQRRHTSCIEALLDAGASTNARPLGKDSMLNMVVISDSKSIAKLLLQRGVDVEERSSKAGESPLFRAVSRGKTSMVKLLLEHGASPAARTTKGQAPLSIAVSRGDKPIVLLLLAQKSIDVEVENENGHRPLYTAVSRGDTSIAEQLLRKGADPSKSPLGEECLLNLAVSRGDSSLTHLLLERGADFEVRNRSGETPLFTAVGRGDTSIVSLLLGKGAGPNTLNAAGESALQRAVYSSNTSIVSLLVGHGADPDLKTASGDCPLYQAIYRNNTSIASILLSHGADPEKKSLSGESPLARAIYMRNSSIVSILLGHGADLAAKTVNGEEMLEYAEKRGDKSIIQLLMSYLPPKLPEK